MLVFLSLLALAYAHNGTCPASKKCSTSGETGLPCCQISSSNFECCSSTEACIPNVGCRCALQYSGYNFELFLQEFSKSYEEPEFKRRQAIFESNLKTIRAHNAEYKAGVHTWHMAVNQFADWSKEEFKAISTTEYRPSVQPRSLLDITKRRPKSMDWRSKGMVTKVKNQGACGSCWAFSATETMESQYAIASGKLLTLAPQSFVNCVQNPEKCGGTGGCEGATMELAFNLSISKGIALESKLPYKGRDEKCSKYPAAVKATSYERLPVNDAKALEAALASKGPVSVTVAADAWQLYGGGIFDGCSKQSATILDHGVQAVGYTQDSWIIRNSWGESWGEKGYIRLSRGSDSKTFIDTRPADGQACEPYPKTQTVGGECGVLFDSSLPLGVTSLATDIVV